MLKVGIRCKDLETKKFITAVCNLNSDKIFVEKDFSHEQLKRNDNDLLIIQEYSSQNNDAKILEFIKNGGKIVLFPESENEDQEYKSQNWEKIESASKNNFFEIQEWNRNEGIFENTANGRELALPYLKILKRKIPTEGETLAHKDGKSFLKKLLAMALFIPFQHFQVETGQILAKDLYLFLYFFEYLMNAQKVRFELIRMRRRYFYKV